MHPLGQLFYVWSPIIGGVVLMLSEALLADSPRFVIISGASLALIIVGIRRALFLWLPKRKRRFAALRSEIDTFLLHARQLNAMARDARQGADGEYPQAMLDLKQAMHDSVERMAAVAGVPQPKRSTTAPKQSDKQHDAQAVMT